MNFEARYDVLVVGTGLSESVVAASMAKSGLTVLHVDANDHYGGDAAGFSLEGVTAWAADCRPDDPQVDSTRRAEGLAQTAEALQIPKESLQLLHLGSGKDAVTIHSQSGLKEQEEEEKELNAPLREDASREVMSEVAVGVEGASSDAASREVSEVSEVISEGAVGVEGAARDAASREPPSAAREAASREMVARARRFNVDLDARTIFAAGEAVDTIIAAGVAHYLEFDSIQGLYLADDQEVVKVPCSKREIFASTDLPPSDKRRLMRLLQFAADAGEADVTTLNERGLTASRALRRPQNKPLNNVKAAASKKKTVLELLCDDHELPLRLAKVVAYAMAFVDGPLDAEDADRALAALHKHLAALGGRLRGCETALLAPIYGFAELPQAFCRACAVHGGVYALRTSPYALVLVDGVFKGALFDKQFVKFDKLVLSADYVKKEHTQERVYRRLVVLHRPRETRCAVVFAPTAGCGAVRALVLGESAKATPDDVCALAHLSTVSTDESTALAALRAASATLGAAELWHLDLSWPLHAQGEIAAQAALVRRRPPTMDMLPHIHEAQAVLDRLDSGLLFQAAPKEEAPRRREDPEEEEHDDLASLLEDLRQLDQQRPEGITTTTDSSESPPPPPPLDQQQQQRPGTDDEGITTDSESPPPPPGA